jgi:hypothetical protein
MWQNNGDHDERQQPSTTHKQHQIHREHSHGRLSDEDLELKELRYRRAEMERNVEERRSEVKRLQARRREEREIEKSREESRALEKEMEHLNRMQRALQQPERDRRSERTQYVVVPVQRDGGNSATLPSPHIYEPDSVIPTSVFLMLF